MDSVISWFILTAVSLFGIARFFWFLIQENERRLDASERAWVEEGYWN